MFKKKKGRENYLKGKTYEEYFGDSRAKIVKEKISLSLKGFNKGKTYEEIYGIEKSKKLRKQRTDCAKGRICSEETKKKISKSNKGRKRTKETRQKMSVSQKGSKHSEETRRKISLFQKGRKFSEEELQKRRIKMKGFVHSEETKRKISKSRKGIGHTEYSKRKISATLQDIPLETWKKYISFEPYCHKFNDKIKEEIRNRDNRACQLCGKSEIKNGERLSVHHIDSNKMQGCNRNKWYLCALCRSCNVSRDTVEKEFLIISNLGYR